MRDPYYCPYCNQRSTRRWNLDVHIKRKHGGLLPDRSSDGGSNPLWYAPNNPYHNIGSLTVADSVGNSFRLRKHNRQQVPLETPQYYTSPMYGPMPSMDDQNYGFSRALKIEELKLLMSKYSQYHENPDGILRLAIYNSGNGDNTLLDDKLQQLRSIDSLANN